LISPTDPRILSRQLELLYRNQRLGQIISILNASLLVWIAAGTVPVPVLLVWWLLVSVIACVRIFLAAGFQQAPSPGRPTDAVWYRRAAGGALISGLAWGAGAVLLMRHDNTILELFTAFVMAGMVAGAVPVLGSSRTIFRYYALPIVLPVVWCGFGMDPLHLAFSVMSALFLLISLRSADHFHDSLTETLRLQHEKDGLLANLESARQETERSNRAKTEFLANISHELRTPMNGIIGLSSLLADEDLSANQQSLLTPLRQSADSLLQQIERLITLSALEAGHIKSLPTPFAASELLAGLLSGERLQAQAKGVTLEEQNDPRLPPILIGDLRQLREVIRHLVDNAIKFTDPGGQVRVEVELLEHTPQQARVRFCIIDNGPGLSDDERHQLNDLMVQIDGSTRRKHGGIGVGLPIVRKYLELMGGELDIESQLGQGSRFCCTLPFALPSAD